MLAFSALGATSMMAFAASNTVASPEHTTRDNDKIGQVNGKVSDDVDYEVDPTDPKKAPRKDKKSRSPKTGATMATGLALAGAGAAVLAAMKKKQDAE